MPAALSRCLAIVLLAFPLAASAWGVRVHALIGELAERQLSEAARAEVRRLLVDQSEPTLAAIAAWPDTARDEDGWAWTAPMHYVKFTDARCRDVLPEDCAGGLCVQGAVERYRADLSDRRLSRAQRAEALSFLVHFVADAHQPLHAGYRDDRGGNDFPVVLAGEALNLHRVWDARLVDIPDGAATAVADRLAPAVAPPTDLPSAEAIARESCARADAIGLYPPSTGPLPADYVARHRPTAEAQIALAASRLAAMIEVALAPTIQAKR